MANDHNFKVKNGLDVGGSATIGGSLTVNGSISGSIDYSDITNPPPIDNSVDYINSASFNTSNGILTLSGIGRAGATVDLDGRYYSTSDSDNRYVKKTGDTMTGSLTVPGVLKITEAGTSQHLLIGNQDSAGANKPAMVRGVNGQLQLGHGDSWSGEGGTMTVGLALSDGKVGIGITNPTDILEISKNSTSGQVVTYRNQTGAFLHRIYADYNNDGTFTEFQTRVGSDGNRTSVGNFSNHDFALRTNNSDRIVIKNGGNVGIGTGSAATKLHIYKDVGYTASTDLLRLEGYTPDFGTTPASVNLLFKFQDSNNTTNEARIKMATVNDTDYGDNDEAASNLIFETTNGGVASDKMIITGRGYIGMGTNNPADPLHVGGRIRSDASMLSNLESISGNTHNFDVFAKTTAYNLYNTRSSTNAPPMDYGTMLTLGSGKAGATFATQLAHERSSNQLFMRGMNDGANAWSSWQRVFADNYHPNADKWTTARSHTVTLTGEVTGTATQTVDGTGNRTWSIATTLNDNALNDHYVQQLGTTGSPNYTTPSSRRVDPNATNPTNEHYAISTFGNDGNVTGQLATHFVNGQAYTRGHNNGWSSWRKIWDSQNFDPATYDNNRFVRKTGDTMSGQLTVNSNLVVTGDLKLNGSDSYIWTPNTAAGYTGFWDQYNARLALQYTNNHSGWGVMGNSESGTALKVHGNSKITGGLEISGSFSQGTWTSSSQYHAGADNIVLKGNSVGISTIFFESEKDGTNINHPSDFGFIQYHAYGTSTSGEANELIIGVSNDADDNVIINAPNVNGFKFRTGASATDYTVWHAGNFNPSSYLLASNYVDNYADSVAFNTSTGVLTIGRTGSLADLTVDLDGRYLTSETDNQTLSWNGTNGVLSISGGNSVDLDGRYLQSYSETDTLQSVCSRGNTTNTDVIVNGLLTATQKSFTIDHPTKEGHKLRYGSLEGPENGVYVRGRLKDNNTIELPEYWKELVHEDSITVNLTAIGKGQDTWVEDFNTEQVIVGSEGNINCFYTIYGERKDVDKLVTEFKEVQ